MNQSDVARMREQIAAEQQSSEAGLTGYAIVSTHEAITMRIEQGAPQVLQLFAQGRNQDAVRLWEQTI